MSGGRFSCKIWGGAYVVVVVIVVVFSVAPQIGVDAFFHTCKHVLRIRAEEGEE